MPRHPTAFPHSPLAALSFILALLGTSLTAAAEPPPTPATDPAAAAERYLAQWSSEGAASCEANAAGCPRLGESLYNAAIAFQASGQRNKAIMARTVLTNPKYHLDNTEIGRKALFQLAEDYKALTEYARAAELYEAAAIKFPAAPEAPDALMDATVFRLALGEIDRATKNAELYDKIYGAKMPAKAVTIRLGIAATLLEREQFQEAKTMLAQVISRADKVGEIHDKVLAHASFARTLAALEDSQGAEKEYAVVRSLWKNHEVQKRILAEYDTNPRNLGKVLNAVGEAEFFFAERKRKEADAIRYPEYKGLADKEHVIKHINTKVVDWIKKKRPAIEEAEKAYRQVLELQPAPPPRWVVASASRVGQMWARFVAEFRAAPIPNEWKKKGPVPGADGLTYDELRKEYYSKIDEAVEPQKQQAKAAFKICVDSSIKYQHSDEFSRACRVWLEKNYRTEFIRVEEFIPAARMSTVLPITTDVLPQPHER